nr:glycoside hydrolase family 36 N-terminal domain-containing protein [uncultured Mitsuokella sp.]
MIQFDEKTGIFHLSNAKMSYVMQVVRGRYLMHRYWGRKLRTFRDSRPFQEIDRAFSPQPAAYENERTFSLDVLPQEYPTTATSTTASQPTRCVSRTARRRRSFSTRAMRS